jgi:hypothetical protein
MSQKKVHCWTTCYLYKRFNEITLASKYLHFFRISHGSVKSSAEFFLQNFMDSIIITPIWLYLLQIWPIFCSICDLYVFGGLTKFKSGWKFWQVIVSAVSLIIENLMSNSGSAATYIKEAQKPWHVGWTKREKRSHDRKSDTNESG